MPDDVPATRLDRWRRLPRWAKGAVLIPLLAACYVLLVVGLAALVDERPNWLAPLPGFLGGSVGAFLGWRVRRRRLGGEGPRREFDQALSSGRLPVDADPTRWRRLLTRERAAARRVLRGSVVGLAVIGVAVVVIGAVTDIGWALTGSVLVLLAAVGLTVRWANTRQLRLLARLEDLLPPGSVPPQPVQ